LSRTACYLVALNGDPRKEEIAWAKAYFVVQTQIQEAKSNRLTDAQERQQLREKLKEANKLLGGAAKEAGVENFGFFHAAGIRSLYGMTMAELKSKKGIAEKEDYWDRVCGLELSANEFKAQLAKKTIEQKKKRGEINGQRQAELEHERVGKTVRATIHKETGIFLEQLPPEPSLKRLISEEKKKAKHLRNVKPPSNPPPANG
jgi:DNA-damage-inducible protein D